MLDLSSVAYDLHTTFAFEKGALATLQARYDLLYRDIALTCPTVHGEEVDSRLLRNMECFKGILCSGNHKD